MTARSIDLTDWQARAVADLKPGDTFLLIEPLEMQPELVLHCKKCGLQSANWGKCPPENWPCGGHITTWTSLEALPYAVGDRLKTWGKVGEYPSSTLEVTGVTVNRLHDVTGREVMAAGYNDPAHCYGPNCPPACNETGCVGAVEQIQFQWPHQPPLSWADNPWCAFTEVRKI